MRDPTRINRILEKLRAAWLTNPDMRLNQMLEWANHEGSEGKQVSDDSFYLEDDIVEAGLDKLNGL